MTEQVGYRFRIYPTDEQAELINKTIGCSRFVYNYLLFENERVFHDTGKGLNHNAKSKLLTSLKATGGYEWLKEVDSVALQQSLRDLEDSYSRFFKHLAKHPKFKKKRGSNQSYRTIQPTTIRIENGNKIRLPKLGLVKIKLSRKIDGEIKSVSVRRSAAGKYYVSVFVKREMPVFENAGGVIGIDVGLKEFYTDSNGNTVANPKFLRRSQDRLAAAQRKLSRMEYGGKNYEKQRIKVAKLHEKISNQRKDFFFKLALDLVRDNAVICVEKLNIDGMLKNHKLAKSISDASWSSFFNILEYEATHYNSVVVRVETFYPSSQTCSVCGFKNQDVKNLKVRGWICPDCGTHHDRDKNAADNILVRGLEILGMASAA